MRRHTLAACAFLVLSTVMTWPLVRNMGRAVAYPGDPFLNIWILDWDWWATVHSPLSLFHTNAFYPARYSLAFSENLYGIALLLMPLRMIGVDAFTAYNVAMLAGFAFSGFGAYLLGFRLTGSFTAGLAAGVFYAFVPFRFTHSTHVQHVWGGWLPLLIAALLWYAEQPSWKRGITFGSVFLMNGLTNIHWFLLGSFAVAVTIGLFVAAGVRRWRELLIATVVALVLLTPFLYPYAAAAKLYGGTRSWEETKRYSALPSDWLVASVHNRVYAHLRDVTVDPERWLFPGALSLLLAVGALFGIRRFTRPVVIGVLWCAIGFAGSLGLNFWFHTFLFDAVPGFRAIRVAARWSAIGYVGLAILIAVAVALIERRAKWIAYIVPLLFILELRVAPMRWHFTDAEPPEVYTWLAKQKLNGAILELPMDIAGSDYVYLLRSTVHHKKMVNGISGVVAEVDRFKDLWRERPIPDALIAELRLVGCDLIVIHADAIDNPDAANWLRRELKRGRLRFVHRFDGGIAGDWVFSIRGGGVSTSPELEAFLAGRSTRNSSTFGYFDPVPQLIEGKGVFSGWAFSPWGIRSVDLLFEQGRVRVPALLVPDEKLKQIHPHYPRTPAPRFRLSLPRRPAGTRQETDVQPEIVDGRGRRKRLWHHWITWRDK